MKKGRDRIVVIFPVVGIAVKIPLIHLLWALRLLVHDLKGRAWEHLKRDLALPLDVRAGFRGLLFGGLAANWGEFLFSLKTRHPFIQPTYFSFFGLLNIQRYGAPCPFEAAHLWDHFVTLTDGQVFDDSHHFNNPDNFCFHNGELRMLDYGSRQSRGVIVKHGTKIVERFDPTHGLEKEGGA